MLNLIPYFKAMVGSKLSNEKGQGMVEYVLIIALIAIVVIAFFPALTDAIGRAFDAITAKLPSGS
jgi:pilus assembly protein Flp/PilA